MKNVYVLFIYSILFLSLFNCRDKEDPNQESVVNSNFNFNILKEGKYLFEDSNFVKENIRILYLKNGVWTEYFVSNLDAPFGYMLFEHNNHTNMRLFLIDYGKDGIETIRIKYDNITTDEIKAEFSHWENGEALTKLWYNGKEYINPTATIFTIEK